MALTAEQKKSRQRSRKKVTDIDKRIKKLKGTPGGNKKIVALKKERARRSKKLQIFQNLESGKSQQTIDKERAARQKKAQPKAPAAPKQQFKADTGNEALDKIVNTLFSADAPQRGFLKDFGFETDAAKKRARGEVAETFDEKRERALRDFESAGGRARTDLRTFEGDISQQRGFNQQTLDAVLAAAERDRGIGRETRDIDLARFAEDRDVSRLDQDRDFNVEQEQALNDLALARQTFSGARGRTFNAIEDTRARDIGKTQRTFREGTQDTRRTFDTLLGDVAEREQTGQRVFGARRAFLDTSLRDERTDTTRFLTDTGTKFRRANIDRRRRRKTEVTKNVQGQLESAIGRRDRAHARQLQNFNPFV